jgi:hypothetical protein
MTPEEASLTRVVGLLDSLAIPYMVTGSMASSHHGRPRTTHDIDLVIDPEPTALDRLVAGLAGAGFFVQEEVARQALRSRRQFNAIEIQSATKIDLIIRKDRPFSREELSRRRAATVAEGLRVTLASPEDTVLAKLEWAKKAGGSERQLADVAGVLEVCGPSLDRGYIERWAVELGVLDLWRRMAGEGGSLDA